MRSDGVGRDMSGGYSKVGNLSRNSGQMNKNERKCESGKNGEKKEKCKTRRCKEEGG